MGGHEAEPIQEVDRDHILRDLANHTESALLTIRIVDRVAATHRKDGIVGVPMLLAAAVVIGVRSAEELVLGEAHEHPLVDVVGTKRRDVVVNPVGRVVGGADAGDRFVALDPVVVLVEALADPLGPGRGSGPRDGRPPPVTT